MISVSPQHLSVDRGSILESPDRSVFTYALFKGVKYELVLLIYWPSMEKKEMEKKLI